MAHAVDIYLGKRVRHRRWMIGMTQGELADALGVRFQQVQKYEKGMNRIAASRLWDMAEALEVPIGYFFEGLAEAETPEQVEPADGPEMVQTRMMIQDYAKMDARERRRLRAITQNGPPARAMQRGSE